MPSRKHYDWPQIIANAAAADGWRMLFPNTSLRVAKRIRLRQHPDLRRDDGTLEVMTLNEYADGDKRFGDIWVRWVPSTNTLNERKTP